VTHTHEGRRKEVWGRNAETGQSAGNVGRRRTYPVPYKSEGERKQKREPTTK